jgi:hypothetical protein
VRRFCEAKIAAGGPSADNISRQGALAYTLLDNGFVLMNVPSFWQLHVIGLLMVVVVYLDRYQRRMRTELSAYKGLGSVTVGGPDSGAGGPKAPGVKRAQTAGGAVQSLMRGRL